MLTALPGGWLAERFGKKLLVAISGIVATAGTFVIVAVCEGVSPRKVARIFGVNKDTVLSWLVEAAPGVTTSPVVGQLHLATQSSSPPSRGRLA